MRPTILKTHYYFTNININVVFRLDKLLLYMQKNRTIFAPHSLQIYLGV